MAQSLSSNLNVVRFLAASKRAIPVEEFSSTSSRVSTLAILALQAELASVGFTMGQSLMTKASSLSMEEFTRLRSTVISVSTELAGAHLRYVALFKNFPHDIPDSSDYLVRRIIGYLTNAFGVTHKHVSVLSCGHAIDPTLFDLSKFAGCPICQRQVAGLSDEEASAREKLKTVLPVKELEYIAEQDIWDIAQNLMQSKSSLAPSQADFLRSVIDACADKALAYVPQAMPFKEVMALVVSSLLSKGVDGSKLIHHMSTPTDVLRVAAGLSSTKADLSLAEPVRFKLSNPARKFIIQALEALPKSADAVAEEMLKYKGRWLRLGEVLHVGKYASKAPKAAAAFSMIRGNAKVTSFNSKVESLLLSASAGAAKSRVTLLSLLATRPGELVRKVDALLQRGVLAQDIAECILRDGDSIGSNAMIGLWGHLRGRTQAPKPRIFMPKGGQAKAYVIQEDQRRVLTEAEASVLIDAVEASLSARFAKLPTLGSVYVDPTLSNIQVPSSLRSASNGLMVLPRGTRLQLGASTSLVRLFLHWKNGEHYHVDVDLSAAAFDEEWNEVCQLSWTNLRGLGRSCHSGDIRDADGPQGAAEFIDLDLPALRKKGARYAVVMTYVYSGPNFSELDCSAGFMIRNNENEGKHFEAQTVRHRFGLTSSSKSIAPMILDFNRNEVIWVDLSMKSGSFGSLHNQSAYTWAILKNAVESYQHKMSLMDLFLMHASARGTLVASTGDADTVLDESMLFKLDEVLAKWM